MYRCVLSRAKITLMQLDISRIDYRNKNKKKVEKQSIKEVEDKNKASLDRIKARQRDAKKVNKSNDWEKI